jgi:hypothetical protein
MGGRKKPSRSKGGRKIGFFPYPPYTFYTFPPSRFSIHDIYPLFASAKVKR